MKSVSKAGYGLLQWVLAMVKYYEVAKGVAPKRELVNKLQQKKEEAEEHLGAMVNLWIYEVNLCKSIYLSIYLYIYIYLCIFIMDISWICEQF